jgi:hypothetical protein
MLPSTGRLILNRFESNGIGDGQGFFSSLLMLVAEGNTQ